ncbi:prolyl oligopeptidase family serine peptidase [Corynebacterium diphtheriae]
MHHPPVEELELIDSPAALEWAREWSQATQERWSNDALQRSIHEALDTDARIPYVTRRGEYLYNFWRDRDHPRGVWRRTTLESFTSDSPQWQVLIDVDRLAASEEESWVWKGAHVRPYHFDRALIRLSRGGADAVEIREFDLDSGSFVEDHAFAVPEAKTQVCWVDRDTVLVGTDMGAGSLTESGYPARVHAWRRGTNLAEAEEFFCGLSSDLAVSAWAETVPSFERLFVRRALDFYRSRTFIQRDGHLQIIEVPEDCTVVVHREWMYVLPREEYAGIASGGVGAILFEDFLAGRRDFFTVFSPTPQSSVQDLTLTASYVVLTILEDVTSRIEVVDRGAPGSASRRINVGDMVTARVVAADSESDELWLGASSFTQPDTLYRVELGQHTTPEVVKQAPALFDASRMETRQHWATSADGTKIPYFIVGDFSQGPRPTLVGGYGGFEVSLVPGYSSIRGRAWLSKGNYFVQPNLRGGGEFGPHWHESVIRRHRVKIYEDHQAVLEDLRQRGYASQIAVRGGSNGGLLTSVALTRYPEAIDAAVIQVPLTDMLRYHTWSAGASWMAEYGDPDDPAERAVLESYSPLHHVAARAQVVYPPALVTTSTRDDRVHPAHARLFARALEVAGQAVDYWENSEGGHAGAADNAQVAASEAMIYTWLIDALGGVR